MQEIEVYIPGRTTPTDIDGYVDYVFEKAVTDAPVQAAELVIFDEPGGQGCTRIKFNG